MGKRDSDAAGFHWEKRPEFPMGEIPIGTTKCQKPHILIITFKKRFTAVVPTVGGERGGEGRGGERELIYLTRYTTVTTQNNFRIYIGGSDVSHFNVFIMNCARAKPRDSVHKSQFVKRR